MSLTRYRWVDYVPDLGNNRELDDPLTLEVRIGLTRAELAAFGEAVAESQKHVLKVAKSKKTTAAELEAAKKERDVALAAAISINVRVKGSHTIDEQKIETVAQYIAAVEPIASGANVRELLRIVPMLNTVTETEAVFSERLSGGLATTPRRSAANKTSPTDGR